MIPKDSDNNLAYGHAKNTPETIEFILDFSTGVMAGGGERLRMESVQIGRLVFSAK
jgi:hypothetical protein